MSTFTGKLIGGEKLQAQLSAIAQRVDAQGRTQIAAKVGFLVVDQLMPDVFNSNRGGWPSPKGFPRAYRAGGQPLIDTKRLSSSWLYRATAQDVRIGTGVDYAHALDQGATIRPKSGKWLLLPLSPPLARSEVRDFPRGKTGIQAKYPKSFWLTRGPEGPGIYRPSRNRVATKVYRRSKAGVMTRVEEPKALYGRQKSIERIAAGRRQVKIRAYHFARVWPGWESQITSTAAAYVLLGGRSTAPVGGSLDVGAKK